jgi:hypothetical protein
VRALQSIGRFGLAFAAELEARRPADHLELRTARQPLDDLLADAVGEELHLRIAREIVERQHGQHRLRAGVARHRGRRWRNWFARHRPRGSRRRLDRRRRIGVGPLPSEQASRGDAGRRDDHAGDSEHRGRAAQQRFVALDPARDGAQLLHESKGDRSIF